jgi:MoaA/NifB/PqqE/SkfB family radical SAM enzyme
VEIIITKYSISLDYAAIELQAKKYGLKLSYQDDTDSIIKTTSYMPFDLTGSQNIKESFRLCFYSNSCIALSRGRIYTCVIIQTIHIFNKYFNQNLQESEKDSIDIYKAKSIDEILDFLCKPIPFCRYCNWKKCQTQIPWRISKKVFRNGHKLLLSLAGLVFYMRSVTLKP